jgi:hypothetical protein
MKVAVPVQFIGSHNLPAAFSREIGRIIIKFAYLEWYLKRVPIALLNISLAQGYVAVRSPRMSDLIDMIIDLEKIGPTRLPPEMLAKLKADLPEIERRRDRIAHGGWAQEEGRCYLAVTAGNWPKYSAKHVPTGKRKITPEMVEVPLSELRLQVDDLDAAIQFARKIGDVLERNTSMVTKIRNTVS